MARSRVRNAPRRGRGRRSPSPAGGDPEANEVELVAPVAEDVPAAEEPAEEEEEEEVELFGDNPDVVVVPQAAVPVVAEPEAAPIVAEPDPRPPAFRPRPVDPMRRAPDAPRAEFGIALNANPGRTGFGLGTGFSRPTGASAGASRPSGNSPRTGNATSPRRASPNSVADSAFIDGCMKLIDQIIPTPQAPVISPETRHFFQKLAALGFEKAALGAFARFGITCSADLVAKSDQELKSTIESMQKSRRSGVADAIFGSRACRKLYAFRYYLLYVESRGDLRPTSVVYNSFTTPVCDQWIAHAELCQNHKNPDPPTFPTCKVDCENFDSFALAFKSYLSQVRNHVLAVPLTYVIRDEEIVTYEARNATYHDISEDLQRTTVLSGHTYQADNEKVWHLLWATVQNSIGQHHVQPFQKAKDGRGAWMALTSVALGLDSKELRRERAMQALNTMYYTGRTRNFSLDQYTANHIKHHATMKELGCELTEVEKCRLYKNGLLADALQPLIPSFSINPQLNQNFDAMVQMVSHYSATHLQRSPPKRAVSAVDTRANNRNNRSNSRTRGKSRGQSKKQKNDSAGDTDVDTTNFTIDKKGRKIHLTEDSYFSKDTPTKYSDLFPHQAARLKELRARKKARQSDRGTSAVEQRPPERGASAVEQRPTVAAVEQCVPEPPPALELRPTEPGQNPFIRTVSRASAPRNSISFARIAAERSVDAVYTNPEEEGVLANRKTYYAFFKEAARQQRATHGGDRDPWVQDKIDQGLTDDEIAHVAAYIKHHDVSGKRPVAGTDAYEVIQKPPSSHNPTAPSRPGPWGSALQFGRAGHS